MAIKYSLQNFLSCPICLILKPFFFILTAAALYGNYKYKDKDGTAHDVDIIIPHAWFPIVAAHQKADEDNIPIFGWKEEGWLDFSNGPTVNHIEVVNWYQTVFIFVIAIKCRCR